MIRLQVRRCMALAVVLLVVWPGVPPATAQTTVSLANPGVMKSLMPGQRAAVLRDGFEIGPLTFNRSAVHRVSYTQFYDLYRDNLFLGVPSFITTDSMAHMFHIMYDKTLVAMERELLAPKLSALSEGLLAIAASQYSAGSDPSVRSAARLNIGYVAVADVLLNSRARIPALISPQVRAEIALIRAHRGPALSPIFGYQIDYSQFAPRGHYNLTPGLQSYFMAMMWYGRVSFSLNGPDAVRLTRQALLLVHGLTQAPQLLALWNAIFDPATAWVGHSDDLTIRDYAAVMARVYPNNFPIAALGDTAKLARFIAQARALPNPQINAGGGGAAVSKGMRLFPQRFVPDAAMMQALIWTKVGTRQQPRLWPMGLDVAAVLGSTRATALLSGALHQTRYAHYTQQLSKLRHQYAAVPAATWNQNLYWRWLDTLRAIWSPAPPKAPSFMRTPQWSDKELATGLGSWAELRHDTLLYAKQPYGLGSGGGPPPFRVPYVEPVPAVWSRLRGLAIAFKSTLAAEGLLDHLTQTADSLSSQEARTALYPPAPKGEKGYRAAIDSYIALVGMLGRTASDELNGISISHADAATMQDIGFELQFLDDFFQDNGAGKVMLPQQKIVPVVADIFTEPKSGQVLEEGVGNVLPMYAIVTINGRRWLSSGGVFSYYEFHQPASNRLTDEAWRAMSKRPPLPGWTAGYVLP